MHFRSRGENPLEKRNCETSSLGKMFAGHAGGSPGFCAQHHTESGVVVHAGAEAKGS